MTSKRERAVVRAANLMCHKMGWLITFATHEKFELRRARFEQAIADYRHARLAAVRRKR